MAKTVIAVDIDEVLSPYVDGLVNWHNSMYGTSFQFDDFISYEFHRVWGGTLELAVAKSDDYFQNRKPEATVPLQNAKQALEQLQQDYELIVVTSRKLIHKPETEHWIQEYFPGFFKEIIICNHWSNGQGPKMKKSEACLKYNAKYLIDDLTHYVEDAAHAGINGLLFGNYPWNQHTPLHPKIQRTQNWLDVLNYFYPK